MNTTKNLGSLKRVFPTWHQPVPLTANESKKLLDTLKTSFRSTLDKEHGWDAEESRKRPAPQRPTDRHLNSILSNPLFKQTTQTIPRTPTTPARRDPMRVFDEAVSKGMMSRRAATGCLLAKRREIQQSDSVPIHTAMAESQAGRRVVQWLRTSGEERRGAFLADDQFVKELVGFLVAEELDEIVWSWAHSLAKTDDAQGAMLTRLLSHLVKARSRLMDDKSLDAAYADMIRADETWRASPNLPRILQNPWRHLSWCSTVEAWNRPQPSDALFEKYVGVAEHLATPVQVDLAHLDLHHPTKPDHRRALDFLSMPDWGMPTTNDSRRFVNRVASMGMDTVKHLTQIGQAEQAEWVAEVLRTRLPPQLTGYGSIPVL